MEKTISQQIQDLFLLHSLDLELLGVDRLLDLRSRFNDLRKQLVELTIAADVMGGTRSSVNMRLDRLSSTAGKVIKEFFDKLSSESQGFITELAQAESIFSSAGFNTMLGTDYFEPSDNAKELAENLVVMGYVLPDLFDSQAESLVKKYQQSIVNSARRGFTNDQLVSRIRGTNSVRNMRVTNEVSDEAGRVQGFTFASPITQRSQADVSTIMITAMAAIVADSSSSFVMNHPEVFQGIQHKSVLDLVTSKICRGYANKCWDLKLRPILGNQMPYPGHPPLHFRCRSHHVPLMLPFRDLPEDLRNSMSQEAQQAYVADTAPAESGSFNSWFKSVDPSVRIATIGRTLNTGFEQGLLTGSDILNRRSGVSINIKEYKQRVEKGFKR